MARITSLTPPRPTLSFRKGKCKDFGACSISRLDNILIQSYKTKSKAAEKQNNTQETQNSIKESQHFDQALFKDIVDREIEDQKPIVKPNPTNKKGYCLNSINTEMHF